MPIREERSTARWVEVKDVPLTDLTMVAVTITAVSPADLHHQCAHQYHQAAAVLAPVQDLLVAAASVRVAAQGHRAVDLAPVEVRDRQVAAPLVAVADHQ